MQSLVLLNTLQGAKFLCLLNSVASNNYLRPEQSSIGHSVWLIILIPSVSYCECTVDLMVVTPREGWLSHTCKSQHERIDFGFIWKKKKERKFCVTDSSIDHETRRMLISAPGISVSQTCRDTGILTLGGAPFLRFPAPSCKHRLFARANPDPWVPALIPRILLALPGGKALSRSCPEVLHLCPHTSYVLLFGAGESPSCGLFSSVAVVFLPDCF